MLFFYFQVPNPKNVIYPYSRMKICASQKTAVLMGLQPSNSNRQTSFRKTMSACSQLFPGYVHGGIVAIQPPKSLEQSPTLHFLLALCARLTGYYHTESKRTQRVFFLLSHGFRIPTYQQLPISPQLHSVICYLLLVNAHYTP